MTPVVVVPTRIQPCQHRGLVDLQQEHPAEAVGQLQLIVRTTAYVQRRWCCGLNQFVQADRIPRPAVPGKPGEVRIVGLICLSHHVASSVNHPRKPRVVVCVNGRQAAAGKHAGDRGLSCAGTACDLDSAHRCLSSRAADGRCYSRPSRPCAEEVERGACFGLLGTCEVNVVRAQDSGHLCGDPQGRIRWTASG